MNPIIIILSTIVGAILKSTITPTQMDSVLSSNGTDFAGVDSAIAFLNSSLKNEGVVIAVRLSPKNSEVQQPPETQAPWHKFTGLENNNKTRNKRFVVPLVLTLTKAAAVGGVSAGAWIGVSALHEHLAGTGSENVKVIVLSQQEIQDVLTMVQATTTSPATNSRRKRGLASHAGKALRHIVLGGSGAAGTVAIYTALESQKPQLPQYQQQPEDPLFA